MLQKRMLVQAKELFLAMKNSFRPESIQEKIIVIAQP